MTTINQLSTLTTLSSSDKLAVYSNENGDARKASMATLLAFIEDQFASPQFTTVINAPTSSGFSINIPADTTGIWMILNPTGPFAAGTLVFPATADCFDGQEIIVCATQSITTLTLNGNGSTLVGTPSSLGAGGFFTVRFNALQSTWYCTSQNIVGMFSTITLTSGINDANGNELLNVTATAAAVNELTLANAATGGAPSLAATGADANISINLAPKGTGRVEAGGSPLISEADVAAGIVTFLETPSSANLRAALTDETGTGLLVFQNGALGSPTALSIVLSQSMQITPTTVAGLGSAVTNAYAHKTVTDSNATLTAGIGAVVVGGGANVVPVFSDGADWRIG